MGDAANERAIREPLPSNTVKAFVPDEIIVSISPSVNADGVITTRSVKIRKSTALDIYIFKLTGSPIYKLIMGDVEETKSGDRRVYAGVSGAASGAALRELAGDRNVGGCDVGAWNTRAHSFG